MIFKSIEFLFHYHHPLTAAKTQESGNLFHCTLLLTTAGAGQRLRA